MKRASAAGSRAAWPSILRFVSAATGTAGILVIACSLGARLWLGRHSEAAVAEFELARAAAVDGGAAGGRQSDAAAGAIGAVPRNGSAAANVGSGADRLFAGRPDQSLWSDGRVRAYRDAVVRLSAQPTAVLEIPSVGVRAPVYAGTGTVELALGAGLIEGSPPPGARGNVGIAAHRDGYFRALKDVKVGADVVVETLHAAYRYEIAAINVVDPDEVQVLDPTPVPALTLVTCYPFYFVGPAPRRFIVRAYLAPERKTASE